MELVLQINELAIPFLIISIRHAPIKPFLAVVHYDFVQGT